jgi:riboflavin synthase
LFTGLVEEVGRLKYIERSPRWVRLEVEAAKVLSDLRRGDSIAVDGVCLTAVSLTERSFTVEVMAETLSRTTLRRLQVGSRVNLERALVLGGRLGGHFVTGHVDGVGTIVGRETRGLSVILFIQAPPDLLPYLVSKGSVAVDGVSLTVVERHGPVFSVSLVSHTLSQTTLGEKVAGEEVNLEADIIAKYLAGLLASGSKNQKEITVELLAEHGFI